MKVTDPALLAQLNSPTIGEKVTDPKVLAQLNGGSSAPAPQEDGPILKALGAIGDSPIGEVGGVLTGLGKTYSRTAARVLQALYPQETAGLSSAPLDPHGIGENIGSVAGYGTMMPGAIGSGYGGAIATGALAGGAAGALQPVQNTSNQYGESAINALKGAGVGALGGAIIPPIASLAGKAASGVSSVISGARQAFSPAYAEQAQTAQLISRLRNSGVTGDAIRGAQADANSVGLNPNIVDAAQNPALTADFNKISSIPSSNNVANPSAGDIARNALQQRASTDFPTAIKAQIDAIGDPNKLAAGQQAQQTAKQLYTATVEARAMETAPMYQQAASQSLPDSTYNGLMSDPYVNSVAQKVLNKPLNQSDMLGSGIIQPGQDLSTFPNSVGAFQKIKAAISGAREKAAGSSFVPGNPDEARMLGASQSNVNQALEGASPDYAAANQAYAQASKPIDALNNSPVGDLANLKGDEALTSATQNLFSKPSPLVSTTLKQLDKVDPTTSNNLRATYMQNILDNAPQGNNGAPDMQWLRNQLWGSDEAKALTTAGMKPDRAAATEKFFNTLSTMLETGTSASTPAGVQIDGSLPKLSKSGIISSTLETIGNVLSSGGNKAMAKILTSPDLGSIADKLDAPVDSYRAYKTVNDYLKAQAQSTPREVAQRIAAKAPTQLGVLTAIHQNNNGGQQ